MDNQTKVTLTDNQLTSLMESSIIPALLTLVEGVGLFSDQQTTEHALQLEKLQEIIAVVHENQTLFAENENAQVLSKLVQTITSLQKHVKDSVIATNELINLQKEQNILLKSITDTFIENTSRLDVLSLNVSEYTGATGLTNAYKSLQERIDEKKSENSKGD